MTKRSRSGSSTTEVSVDIETLEKEIATLKEEVAQLKKDLAAASKSKSSGGSDPRVDVLIQAIKSHKFFAKRIKESGL